MIWIILDEEIKYYTDAYSETQDGWLIFTTFAKSGKAMKHQVRKSAVREIVDVGEQIEEKLDKKPAKSKD